MLGVVWPIAAENDSSHSPIYTAILVFDSRFVENVLINLLWCAKH